MYIQYYWIAYLFKFSTLPFLGITPLCFMSLVVFALFLDFASHPCHPLFCYSRQRERRGQASPELESGCRKTAAKATIDHLQTHNNSFINTYLKFDLLHIIETVRVFIF